MAQSQQLKDLGEAEILQLLQKSCPAEVIGDDGAVVEIAANHQLVVTTDVLVDGVHFSDRTTTAEMAGWRAVAANLSDLAAMGATPVGITVGLSLPSDTELVWLEHLYEGIGACLAAYDTPLVGGDLTRSPVKTIAITAFGEILQRNVIRRDAAQMGDVIVATGFHGDSRAGLELLLKPETGLELEEGDRRHLILAHQKPLPRLDISAYLNDVETERNFAGMDSSDGLADAVLQICEMSQVGAIVHRSQLPISPALSRYQSSEKALEWSLYGGEDFQLVLGMGRSPAEKLVEEFGSGCSIIGEITAEKTVKLMDEKGQFQTLSHQQTFQHF